MRRGNPYTPASKVLCGRHGIAAKGFSRADRMATISISGRSPVQFASLRYEGDQSVRPDANHSQIFQLGKPARSSRTTFS
jgi:hypothetical protein